MNDRFKYSILILQLFLLSPFVTFSQTHIGASIGYDFFSTPNSSYKDYYRITESANSLGFGLEIRQDVSRHFFISMKGAFSKKDVPSYRLGFTPINHSKFKVYQLSTEFGYTPIKNLYFSAGINFTYIPDVIALFDENIYGNYTPKSIDFGGAFSTGYQYKNFFIELYYRKALKNINYAHFNLDWKSQAVGILIGYRLQLFDKIKFNGKKANCPKL